MGTPTSEKILLLDATRRAPSAASLERVRATAAGQVSWERVVDLAEAHGVWAPLLESIQRLELPVPEALRFRLEQKLVETTAQNLARTAQLARILEWLNSESVPAVAFKGPSLAAIAADPVGSRSSVDLDLLVAPKAARRVRAIMLDRGYTPVDSGPDGLDGVYPPARREDLFRPPEDDLAPVEVQVTVATWPLAVHLDPGKLIARAITVETAGLTIPTLCAEDLLLTLAVHGTRDTWSRLRLVADIDAAARANPDWDLVAERAAAARIQRILSIALLVTHQLHETPLPYSVIRRANRDRPAVRLASHICERLPGSELRPYDATWERRVWTHSRERRRDGARCYVRLLVWKWLIWPIDQRRRRPATGLTVPALETSRSVEDPTPAPALPRVPEARDVAPEGPSD